MAVHHKEASVTIAQRWMQFLVTSGTIVVSTVGCVWAVMVYALDNEYVQIEDFDEFKHEVKLEIREVVGGVNCQSIINEIESLNITITFKEKAQEDAALERLLRDNKVSQLHSDVSCRNYR